MSHKKIRSALISVYDKGGLDKIMDLLKDSDAVSYTHLTLPTTPYV